MPGPNDDLGHLWEWFAHHQFRGYSPLYERIASAVAHDEGVLDLVRGAPSEAHLPPALLGAVQYLLLDGLDHPLVDVYAGRSSVDPAEGQQRGQLGPVGPAEVEEQGRRVDRGPSGVDIDQRVIEPVEQEVLHGTQQGRGQVRLRWGTTDQVEHPLVVGHHRGDPLVERRVAAELMVREPLPQVAEVTSRPGHGPSSRRERCPAGGWSPPRALGPGPFGA